MSLTPVHPTTAIPSWEPSWQPFSVDLTGHAWTSVDSKERRSGIGKRLWSLVDAAWRSTDQKVGGASPLEHAAPTRGFVLLSRANANGPLARWFLSESIRIGLF